MHRDAMRKAIRNIMVIIDENDKGLIKLSQLLNLLFVFLAEEYP